MSKLLTLTKLAPHIAIDAVEFASRSNAILGIKDSGKTYTATMIAEQLFDVGIPFFTLDPIGRWRFLRSPSASAGGKGYPIVVAGGRAPDLPLTPENAPKLVRAAMAAGVSLVLDLYSVELSKADWRRIVKSSIETILFENEGHGLRHVFLEEAAEFVPQKNIMDGVTYAAVEKLARMGGNVGCGLTLINQRAEEVNKAVLELCDNLLLHRQRGKNSLLSLRKWLEAGNVRSPKDITDSLADLPTGECWAWLRDLGAPRRITVRSKLSFDPNRRTLILRPLIRTNVSTFVEKMKAALEGKPAPKPDPKQEDKDVKESEARALRKENDQLKAEVKELRERLDFVSRETVNSQDRSERTEGDAPTAPRNMNEIVEAVIQRVRKDATILRLLATKPEIEVRVERKIINIEVATLKGKVAKLLADGFYDVPRSNNSTTNEIKRVFGAGVNFGNLAREMKALTGEGFLTAENDGYRAVEGMKVNIVEG